MESLAWSDIMASCEVCRRLEGDVSPKRVKFCRLCEAWMCEKCYGSLMRRALAAIGPLVSLGAM